MNRLATVSPLLVVASLALDIAPAAAQPTVIDHRTEAQPPPPPPPPGYTGEAPRRYRRRPGPRFMVPLKIDIGMQGANTSIGYLPGIEIRAGIHWASLSPVPTNTDVGIGVFGAALSGTEDPADPQASQISYGGAYLEIGQTLSHGSWWRTWAAGRGEVLEADVFHNPTKRGYGAAARISAEAYISGVGIAPEGLFLGTYAIGVYAELAGRTLGDGVDLLQISAGLTFRTPLVFNP